MSAEEKVASAPIYCADGNKYRVFSNRVYDPDNSQSCVIAYVPDAHTADQIAMMSPIAQRFFAKTYHGVEKRVCLKHMDHECMEKCTFCVEYGGTELHFDLECVIMNTQTATWVCTTHSSTTCFVAMNYVPAVPFATDNEPVLQTSSLKQFQALFGDLGSTLNPSLDELLFAMDHFYTKNSRPVDVLCEETWRMFRLVDEDFDIFVHDLITLKLPSFQNRLAVQQALHHIWTSFKRRGENECHIKGCACMFDSKRVVAVKTDTRESKPALVQPTKPRKVQFGIF